MLEVKVEKQKSSIKEDDLSQPWVCEETDPFTPRIRYFDFPKKTRMPSNVKTYDESEDPKDHLKIFQAAAKVEAWQSATCEFLQQKKCIKDHVEIHHIKQREGESTEDFVQRFKSKSRHVKGAPECMRISGFMHKITNPELIKRLHDNNLKSMDEMMRATTVFLRGDIATSHQAQKKTLSAWKEQEIGRIFFNKRGDFMNQQRSKRRHDRNNNKFCEFHGEVGHTTDEYMHLKIQIKELTKAGKLSHVIKELKQGSGKDQPKVVKKGEASGRDKALEILMVRPWQRVARQRVTQSFSPDQESRSRP
ncbi:hypothetical protein Tco_0701967 [Tanacetum coccineum]|uniref:Reverse transcriptase domain-containing protein n=1 Tax=Tanacetum coccineum TaxID=301880 RepID=A0ABQ4XVJ5_9ASTR